ncbi:hypothetical protein [Thiorhodovibrio frisius]|uniref:Uncharacterized protein n=1 Tax=Thiorhodovibrio frisius TaxID=631362 RepID=H8YWZ4_9GAMM|nr:hypothetical protein [Thiorhodovibrio frisius]EIC22970.1 hypothetical protein Thi970DRAFT_00617 [Thiorhodovibrio frisius]WPL22765.1 hypothetical protein Thiofri_02935 [Thiorhodovibrio frisius]
MSGLMTGWRRPGPPQRPSAIAPSLVRVVENALSRAWRALLEEVTAGRFSLCAAKEDEITEQLQIILGELHAAESEEVRGFSEFSLGRDSKLRSHDGKHLDRQPDLTFYPLRGRIRTTNSALAGIFVECKPIDSKHPIPSTYCKEGLIRFIRGDYAWAADRALMVAYVRNHCRLPEGLLPCILKDRSLGSYQFRGVPVATTPTDHGDAVYQTIHGRTFTLTAHPAGPITLHHLWLYPAHACEETKCQSIRAPNAS